MTLTPSNPVRWTVSDLEGLPENSDRYEIIDGELLVTRAPHFDHQDTAGAIYMALRIWSQQSGLGKAAMAPSVIFSSTDAVIPDLVWMSQSRLQDSLDASGHLTQAPELVVEVLSNSAQDKKRDYETKLKLYSIQGVMEYWIVDRQQPSIEVFRRDRGLLSKTMTLYEGDQLTSPLLPGFSCLVATLLSS
jgi:Uma2 family endonuclease